MHIPLKKIGRTPLNFELCNQNVTFKGILEYHGAKLILLEGELLGSVELSCSLCAEDFAYELDDEVSFFLSDGIYEQQNDEQLDVVEIMNGVVDLEEILHSEIEMIRSDYHVCDSCQESTHEYEY